MRSLEKRILISDIPADTSYLKLSVIMITIIMVLSLLTSCKTKFLTYNLFILKIFLFSISPNMTANIPIGRFY